MVIKSWENKELLESLAEMSRNGEIVQGVVRSATHMNLPKVMGDGKVGTVKEETLIVALPGGITGYCPASEFMDYQFASLSKFVGTKQKFVVTRLDLENEIALLSEKKAGEQLRNGFWEQLIALDKAGTLQDEVFTGVITGHNQRTGMIYVRIAAQDTYMFRKEWSWNERDIVDAQIGETVEVKVEKYDEKEKLVRVSRRAALPDPAQFLETLKRDQIIAGKVESVHPIHGIFVEVATGVSLKAGKIKSLEEPDVGEMVTCSVKKIDSKNRKGKVVIIGYPQGKRKKKDLGSFLFD